METSINQIVTQMGGACEKRMTQGGERWAAKQFISKQLLSMVAQPVDAKTFFAELVRDSNSPTLRSLS